MTCSENLQKLSDVFFLRAEWFGAKGDGKTDDRPAIQTAIDCALQHQIREVKLSDGVFKISNTLHLGYGEYDPNRKIAYKVDFNTISLTGTGKKFTAESSFGGTAIIAEFKDRPAIAIQGARYSEVKGLTIKGQYDPLREIKKQIEDKQKQIAKSTNPDELPKLQKELEDLKKELIKFITNQREWVDSSCPPSADSQYAPYAGIAIDPYSGDRKNPSYPDVNYPDWTCVVPGCPKTQYNKAYSSGVLIENVEILGFVVGIVNQPCDADGNGDFTKIHKCSFGTLKYGISIGNSQSRNVSIRDCEYAWLHTVLTNSTHGKKIGKFDGPIDNISGGFSYQFADIFLNASGCLHFKNIYFESQTKFGRLGTNASFNSPVVFESCSFGPHTSELKYNPDYFIKIGPHVLLHFIGCSFIYYVKFFNLTNGYGQVVFDSCTFRSTTECLSSVNEECPIRRFKRYTKAEILAHNYTCGGVFCWSPVEIIGAINSVFIISNDKDQVATPYLYSKKVISRTLDSDPKRIDKIIDKRPVLHQGAEIVSYTNDNFPSNFVPIKASKPIKFLGKQSDVNDIFFDFDNEGNLKFTNYRAHQYNYKISIGDLIYDQLSHTLFVVDKVIEPRSTVIEPDCTSNDLTNLAIRRDRCGERDNEVIINSIEAKIVTNFRIEIDKDGQEKVKANATFDSKLDNFILFPCSVFKTNYKYLGDTQQGCNTITNIRRPDNSASEIEYFFKPGDLLFYSEELWEDQYKNKVFPQVTRILSVKEDKAIDKGIITVDQYACRTMKDFKISMFA